MGLTGLLNIELPLIQAPMAGAQDADLVIAVCEAGGLGSLPCATISPEKIKSEILKIRSQTNRPFNLNFFAHQNPRPDQAQDSLWRKTLSPYYLELGLDPKMEVSPSSRNPFDEESCQIIEEFKPSVVSFHFGLPDHRFIERVKRSGAKILSSATTVEEAIWLEANGCDAIIAQGIEAGGHRGIFLSKDLSTQSKTVVLVPRILSAVKIPVIASGGIGNRQDVQEVMKLGAIGVQVGTLYLFTPEAKVSTVHKEALLRQGEKITAVTNLFTGRPARGIMNRLMREIGPISDLAPEFPLAGGLLAPLKKVSEALGKDDFSSLWAGEAVMSGKIQTAKEVTLELMGKEK